MLTPLKNLFRPKLHSLNTIRIDHKALFHNLEVLKQLQPGREIFPVLKSNAYGHGIEQVAKILRHTDLKYLCVDSVPEYYIVKKFARKPSLIIWETLPQNYKFLNPKWATLCVYNLTTLQALIKTRKKRKIHLFLNTGMNREGIQVQELWGFLDSLKWSKIALEWVMSHFANADELDSSFCEIQVEKFKEMYDLIVQYWFSPQYKHIQNSAWSAKIQDPLFTACRSGIAFYGYSPLSVEDIHSEKFHNLRPALSVQSTIVALQRLRAWDIVSYGGKFVAPQDMTNATIPFGYTEWLQRALRDQWQVKRNDVYLPLIGTICMNISVLDTLWNDVQAGDAVEVISRETDAPNTILQFAKKLSTVPYEVLVNLDPKAKRIVI